jgi:AraC-like DNA-binding protein
MEIVYIYEGQGIFHIRNESFTVSKGDVVIIGSDEMHHLELPANNRLKIMCIFFMPDLIYGAGGDSIDFEYLTPFRDRKRFSRNKNRIYADNNHIVLEIIEKMNIELNAKHIYYQQALKNYLFDILLALLRYYGEKTKRNGNNTRKNQDIERLRSVFTYIQDNYDKRISLSQLSKIACMSPYSLCRLFKKVTGTTTSNYILRTRIDQAKCLLIESNLTITQIAFKVGIEDHSYFDRIFRRFNDTSPKIFRQKHTGN